MYPPTRSELALQRLARAQIVREQRATAAARRLAARSVARRQPVKPQRSVAPQLIGEIRNDIVLPAQIQTPEPITINLALPSVTVNVTLDVPRSKGQTITMPDGSVIETAPKE